MEGGRQADVAKGILTAKNVPYMVAAPLLIQVRNFSVALPCFKSSHHDNGVAAPSSSSKPQSGKI